MENIICYDENLDATQKQKTKFWKLIKNTRKDNTGVSPLRKNGILIDDTKQKAEILNEQYHSVFTVDNIGEKIPTLSDNYHNMPHINIKTEGVEKMMKNLDPSKVSGPDEIPARILKEYAHEFAPLLAPFYNTSLSRGEVPSDWRQVNVIPVFKKGEKYLTSNYRPVSLTCICCKVLEHIVVSNMVNHFEIHDILVDCQHGFRAKRSCETQLTSLTHETTNHLHSGIQND